MCGLTGFWQPSGFDGFASDEALAAMRDRLRHRGPDDAGSWLDPAAGIALGHRRLSVVDLSPAGHQPMVSASGRYVVVFNGEIYNHLTIRHQCRLAPPAGAGAGHPEWRGHSDTETLLAAVERWGVEATLRTAVGMFALALWDRAERTLTLARDRMGEKPLYYGWQSGILLFGSELKALRAHPAFQHDIDRDVLPLYLNRGYIPSPWCIWRGIRKLQPGCWVRFSGTETGHFPVPTPYWTLSDAIEQGQAAPFAGRDYEAVDALEQALSNAIAGQMLADVPVGAFLSGGIDSSTIVALMQARSGRPVKTFTIGFHEPRYNEAHHAKAVAAHLRTDHTELYLTDADARQVIPALPDIYDEPFGDVSAIPTHLVCRLARQHVTVALSGDGGDELFGGYGRYSKASGLWDLTRRVPGPARTLASGVLRSPVPRVLDRLGSKTGMGATSLEARSQLAAAALTSPTVPELYRRYTSQWLQPPVAVPGNGLDYGYGEQTPSRDGHAVSVMMAEDSVTYLPDDILAKVDRAAMAVSLETRVPLLDHVVVTLAWRMPHRLRRRDGHPKWLLRQVLARHVPEALVTRPKMGFGVPVDEWLRGSLRPWADALLEPNRLIREGYLDPEAVTRRWKQHVQGRHNWRDSLWLVLMWQAWMERRT
jgi:asparagine synthase (glutamine-hydrolysing)